MENRWLLTWLLAPWYSPAAVAIEAYSLHWYRLDADSPTATRDLKNPTVTDARVETVRLEQSSDRRRPRVSDGRLSFAGLTRVVLAVIAVMWLAAPGAAQVAPKPWSRCSSHGDDEGPAAPILAQYAREGKVHLIITTDGAGWGALHRSART
jgi:hypothetical protein